eukprot:scaffold19144_cov118-Isochrysis_galbana.AAC.2
MPAVCPQLFSECGRLVRSGVPSSFGAATARSLRVALCRVAVCSAVWLCAVAVLGRRAEYCRCRGGACLRGLGAVERVTREWRREW